MKERKTTGLVTEEWKIEVANPSPYERTDYVEVDLRRLGVPDSLDEGSLQLVRKWPDGNEQEIRFQVDYLFGKQAGKRMLSFLSERTPRGPENYSRPSVAFVLRKGIPKSFSPRKSLWVGHYYRASDPNPPPDFFDREWDNQRPVNGVKLFNKNLEAYFSLVAQPGLRTGIDYTGSATSIELVQEGKMDVLAPFLEPFKRSPESRWGQLTELAVLPTPWDAKWFKRVPLLNQEYELVWSKSGHVRAICTLRSKEMTIRYRGAPFFEQKEVEVNCHLYRVFYVYPQTPFYTEELFLQTREGHSISFRPYYYSYVHSSDVEKRLCRFEHIPDYFAIWLHFGVLFLQYGFASDAHVRWITVDRDEIRWRLPHAHHHKNIHLFTLKARGFDEIEWFHDVGHTAWYERVFKPLEVYPLGNKYPLPEP